MHHVPRSQSFTTRPPKITAFGARTSTCILVITGLESRIRFERSIVEVGNSWENLEAVFPQVPFTWLELEYGGHGVFVFTREELLSHRAAFS